MYRGDISVNQSIFWLFPTQVSGVLTSLVGGVLSVYKDDVTTETTTGPTLTADFDGRTGLNSVKIATTDAFYAAGHDYTVVITTGTVGGASAVGYVVGTFSIQNRFVANSVGVTTILADYARRTGDYVAPGDLMVAADVRSALGMATANMDAQLAEIEGETDDIATILTAIQNGTYGLSALQVIVAAIKTQTDKMTFHGSMVKADIKEVDDTTILGTGTPTTDEFRTS
jgi:hypothetical protein